MSDSSMKDPQEHPRQSAKEEFPSGKHAQVPEAGEGNYRAPRQYFRAAEQLARSRSKGDGSR